VDDRRPIPLPVEWEPAAQWVAGELSAAITLVAEGHATRITIANVDIDDEMAGQGAALAQRAGVGFAVENDPVTGRRAMTVGPRL
jgi:hypothetical protein